MHHALLLVLLTAPLFAQQSDAEYIRENYTKLEKRIPMRDGVKLFTSIYVPKGPQKQPILLQRTPYGVAPYGERYKTRLGPSSLFGRSGYVFAYQDVRGKFMSEGEFVAVRPHIPEKGRPRDIDESTDAYDTIAWLLENVPNNGKVGAWGISAPGFYATHALIDSHPALQAVSPQAPVTDWFLGDDRHHNGAFMFQASFSFVSSYGEKRPQPTTQTTPRLSRLRDTGRLPLVSRPRADLDDQRAVPAR